MESTLAVGVATCVNPQDLFSAIADTESALSAARKRKFYPGHRDDILPLLCIRGGSSWHWFSAGLYVIRASNFTVSVMVNPGPPFQPRILFIPTTISVYIEDLVQAKQIVIASLHHSLLDVTFQMATKTWQTDNFSGGAWDWLKAGIGWGICRNP